MTPGGTFHSWSNSRSLEAAARFLKEACATSEVLVLGATKAAADEFVREWCGGGMLGVHALTLTQLAGVVAAPKLAEAGLVSLTPLGAEAVAARVAYAAVREGGVGYFAPVADLPGFARAVARTLTEVRFEGLTPADLRSGGPPGADLALLLERYENELRDRALADLPEIFSIALQQVSGEGHRLAGLPLILLDVPLEHELQRNFAASLLERAPAAFQTALGSGGEEGALVLDRVRKYLFSPEAPPGDTSGTDLIFSAPGEGLECVEIARRIRALAEQGTPFDRVAVLLRDVEQYQPLMEEALRRAGIPEYFSRGTARPDPAGRAFLALLACAEEGCSASRFAEYLSLGQTPPLDASGAPPQPPPKWTPAENDLFPAPLPQPEPEAPDQSTDESPVVAGTLAAPANWEKLLVDAAVIGGYERWARRLAGLHEQLQLHLASAEDDMTRAYLERQLQHLGNLHRFALPLVEFLHSLPKAAAWGEWLERLTELAGMSLWKPGSVLSVLSELQPMADVGPVTLAEVHGVLSARLGTLRREPPRRRYGSLFVGSIEEARGRAFDVVFLPGLAEGIFPRRAPEDPLLLDDRRAAISDRLERGDQRAARERLLLRIAAAAARESLVVSYPRVNVAQSRPRVPSFYALEVLRAAEGKLPNLREFEKRASAGAATRLDWPAPRDSAQAIDNAEYDLAWLRAAGAAKGAGRYLVEVSPLLAESLRTRWRRWDPKKWHAADGIVDPDAAALAALAKHRPADRAWSPSSLQHYAACPYRFFLHGIARLRPREEPAPLEQLDPLTRGSLFHSIQFELMRELAAAGLLPVASMGLAEVLDRADAVIDRVAADYAEKLAPAVSRVWQSEIEDVRTDVRGWLQHIAAPQPEWQPLHFEYAFGLDDDVPRDPASTPNEAVLSCGVRLRGAIDLIERHLSRGTLRITDHKTGKRPEQPPAFVGGGAFLQPILYGLAAEQLLGLSVESSRLFYCTQRGEYTEAPVPLSADARQKIAQVIAAIDEAISRGFLPAAPAAGACSLCDYRTVCGPYEEQRTSRKPKTQLEELNRIRSMP